MATKEDNADSYGRCKPLGIVKLIEDEAQDVCGYSAIEDSCRYPGTSRYIVDPVVGSPPPEDGQKRMVQSPTNVAKTSVPSKPSLLDRGSMEGIAKDVGKRKKVVEELAKLKSFFAQRA